MCHTFVIVAIIIVIVESIMSQSAGNDSKISDSIVIYANSAKFTGNVISSFTINLTRPITQIKSFEVLGVEIPFSFYNVWRGNTAIGEFNFASNGYVNETLYHLIQSNTNGQVIPITETSMFYGSVLKLAMIVNTNKFILNVTRNLSRPYYYGQEISHLYIADFIGQSIDNGITNCTVRFSGYRLEYFITTNIPFTKIGFLLDGTDTEMASYLGLTQDTIFTSPTPVTFGSLLMPTAHQVYNVRNPSAYVSKFELAADLYSNPPWWVRPGMSGNYAQLIVQNGDDSTLFVDPSRHYIGHILGFDGFYTRTDTLTATNQLPVPIAPPRYYDNAIYIANLSGGSRERIEIPVGYYTASQLATAITSQFQTNARTVGSSATVNSAGIFTINMSSDIRLYELQTYGWKGMLTQLGFGDLLQVRNVYLDYYNTYDFVGASRSTTAPRPSFYIPKNIYIGSTALAQLTSNLSVTDTDDPVFQKTDIIHKVQINANPGGIITDNQKYQSKRLVSHSPKTPITKIDFSLYDEDGQLVQLNGRNWSIGIKIEF